MMAVVSKCHPDMENGKSSATCENILRDGKNILHGIITTVHEVFDSIMNIATVKLHELKKL